MERKEEENGRETGRKKRGWGGKWRGRRKEKSKKGEDRKGRGLWSGKGRGKGGERGGGKWVVQYTKQVVAMERSH